MSDTSAKEEGIDESLQENLDYQGLLTKSQREFLTGKDVSENYRTTLQSRIRGRMKNGEKDLRLIHQSPHMPVDEIMKMRYSSNQNHEIGDSIQNESTIPDEQAEQAMNAVEALGSSFAGEDMVSTDVFPSPSEIKEALGERAAEEVDVSDVEGLYAMLVANAIREADIDSEKFEEYITEYL